MQRFITTFFISLVLVGGIGGALVPVAHADPPAPTAEAAGAGSDKPMDMKNLDTSYNWIMLRIMSLFALLVGIAALTLDYAMYYTVVHMGSLIGGVNGISAIGLVWSIMRDLGNIMLIFGFLAIGISMIIGHTVYAGQKMLPMLLIAAVFLNFSLFASEAVIDVGNLFATQFYKQINGGSLPTSAASGILNNPSGSALTPQNEGISNKIMSQLGMTTLYGNARDENLKLMSNDHPFLIGFVGILLFITTAFVLFSLAFILIFRFVMLVFIIILAPIGLAGLAIPKLSGAASKWWSDLFGQTMTAPILLLLLYVALRVITDERFLTGLGVQPGSDAATGFINNYNLPGFAGFILSFIIAMGLLLMVTMYAKRLGASGADLAMKWGGRVTGALSFGAISLAGRGSLGLLGRGLNTRWMRSQASKRTAGGALAKAGAFAGRNLESRTFDFRNIPKARQVLGSALGAVGQGSSGIEGVFAAGASLTAKKAFDKTREGINYVKFSGAWWRDQKKEYEDAAAETGRKSDLTGAILPTIPPNPASVAAQGALKKMSVDELAQLRDIRKGINTLVYNLSPEKFNELMKSDKLLAGEKKKLKNTWDDQFTNAATATAAANPARVATTIGRLNTDEIVALGGGTLTKNDVIDNLGVNEFDAIRRKGSLNKQQRHDIHARMMSAPTGSVLKAQVDDYFLATNDVGKNRKKYWDV